jgi:tRNA (guanine37-N1)-methyltransferase
MVISVLTLFPDMFRGPFDASIIARAQKMGHVTITYVNIREYATDKYKSVDDHPYGGGTGMVMRVDIMDRAISAAKSAYPDLKPHVVLLDPQGTPYRQEKAKEYAAIEHLILVCAHYEGIDERIRDLVDEELSIGDYVVTGGEIPAMVVIDSVVRLIPGVLKRDDATLNESFQDDLLEYPQYTRPPSHNGKDVPSILLSGNHEDIDAWRENERTKRTKKRRPDLMRP